MSGDQCVSERSVLQHVNLPVSIKHGLRTTDCGLGIKYGLGIKRGLGNTDWV